MTDIQIDAKVDMAEFQYFYSKYKEFSAQAAKQPGTWKDVAQQTQQARKNAQDMAAANEENAESLSLVAKAIHGMRGETEKLAHSWMQMQRHTLGVAGNMAHATASLLKWAGITSVIGALTGGVGLFGMDRLADHVSSNRSASMGLSTNYGKRQSFITNFGRYGDAEGVLGRVNAVQHSADKQALLALGLTREEIQGDTSDVAAKAALALQRLVKRTRPEVLGDTLRSRHITDIFDVNQAQVYGNTETNEVEGQFRNYQNNSGRMNLTSDQQSKFQEFSTQMGRAGKTIENVFVKNLSNLTPGLTELSESFVHLVDVLMEHDGPLKQGLDWLNEGLEWLAKEIDTPEFQVKVTTFIKKVGDLAKSAGEFVTGIISFGLKVGLVSPAEAATSGSGNGAGGPLGVHSPTGSGPSGSDDAGGSGKDASAGNKEGSTWSDRVTGGSRSDSFYEAIQRAEGTAGKDPYNDWLGHHKTPKPLTEMTLKEAYAYGEWFRKNHKIGQMTNSSAKGAFQIVDSTQLKAMRALGLSGDEKMTPEVQRRMADWIYDHQGSGAWEGFKRHPRERQRVISESSSRPSTREAIIVQPAPGASVPNNTGAAAAQSH